MSLLDPNKSDLQRAMLQHAEMLMAKAEQLKTYAESISSFDEADFMAHLGDRHSGPGFMRELQAQYSKASEVRPSETSDFDRALTEVFARAQRTSTQS